MNREILRIALPNIVSNITVPLMGILSTAIAGHCSEDPATTIGALAIGVSIFNFIYWNCSFLRMGTSGLTAQAFGAGDRQACADMLGRGLAAAAVLGLLLLLLQYPIGRIAVRLMNGSSETYAYFYARIWAVPAGILLFALNGWFTGMQNAVIPMWTAIAVNVIHVIFSFWWALGQGWGITGIAYASVVAQYSGLVLAFVLLRLRYGPVLRQIDRRNILDLATLRRFVAINRDIILRTFCIVAVYTFFTAASARMDDPALLAVNTMLLQLFTLFSYMNDGFAFAAEALTGRFIGARDETSLRRALRLCLLWGTAISVLYVGVYLGWWRQLLGLFLADADGADGSAMLDLAGRYIGWIIVIPIASALPFIMDGIMVGATQSRTMRDSMIWSTVGYFAIYYVLEPRWGNDALWLAFTVYMFLRGVLQYFMTRRLQTIYRQAR